MKISDSGMPPDGSAFTALKKYGLLLLNDPALPNLCRLVAGERVRGSWWAHPRAQEIFQVYDALENHADVLILKLISGKVTYIHRTLWPQIVAVGRACEPWQMNDLSAAARKLLAAVDKAPVEPGREKAAAPANSTPECSYSPRNFTASPARMCAGLNPGITGPTGLIRLETPRHRPRRARCSKSGSPISIANSQAGAGCHGKASGNSRDAPIPSSGQFLREAT